MITQPYESLRQGMNRADPNTLADIMRILAGGDVMRALPVQLNGASAGTTGACAQQLATLGTVVLHEDAKAAVILRCTVKATGSAALGEYTIEPYGTTPSSTQVAVAPNGDIVFLGTDLVTQADILYLVKKGDVIGQLAYSSATQSAAGAGSGITSLTLSVNASGFAALPPAYSGKAMLLMQANVTAGAVTGQKIILVPATGVVATTKAALSKDGTGIWLNLATDAPTQVVVDLLVYSGAFGGSDVNALLEGPSGEV
jgi:hypothetical protein